MLDTGHGLRAIAARVRKSLGDFKRSERGSALIYVASAVTVLMLGAGAAVDSGRAYLVKSRLSQALDAAALAGGRNIRSETRNADIQAFFAANYPANYMGATVQPLHIVPDLPNGTITVSTSASMPTAVMPVVGVSMLQISATTTVKLESTGMELALVLDNTYSMNSNNKFSSMKTAAQSMLDILYGNKDTSPNLWVGIVPFVTSVNVGSQYTSWLDASYSAANYTPVGWSGCVEARPDPYEEESADEPPTGSTKFKPYFWPSNKPSHTNLPFQAGETNVYRDSQGNRYRSGDNNLSGSILRNDNEYLNILWASSPSDASNYGIRQTPGQTNQRGPNAGCHWSSILPLQASKATVSSAITNMVIGSSQYVGTHTTVGSAWGWRLVSPKWRGYWAEPTPANMPFDYNTSGMLKVVVILTDGDNYYDDIDERPPGCSGLERCPSSQVSGNYGAYGRLGENRFNLPSAQKNKAGFEAALDARQTRLCNAMKAQGIIIMTILVEVETEATRTMLRNCATKPEYAFTPTSAQLNATFTTIANELSSLRLYR